MKLFYRNSLGTTKRLYYETLDYLTSKAVFDHVFGKNPHMFAIESNNLNST